MSFNSDELVAPEWVNSDFFKQVLENDKKFSNVVIKNFQISPATARGDHFSSVMFRVRLEFSADESPSEKCSMVIKTIPTAEGYKKGMLDSVNVFDIEIYMYTKVLNECQEILRHCGYTDQLAPRIMYTSLNPYKVLVFEDLKELGYVMLPKNIPNEDEIKMIFSKLAQLHGATFKLKADGRDDLNLKGTLFGFSFSKTMPLFRTSTTFLAELLDTLPGFEEYARQMHSISSEWLMDKCIEILNRPASINILNHGDFHIRNMMFKGNESGVFSELALVDFQIPCWGSPAYDLVYMSSPLPYRVREMAFEHYFNVFTDVVLKSGYKGDLPTYDQLQHEIKMFSHLDLFVLASMVVFLYTERNDITIEMDTIMTDSESRKKLYKNAAFISHVKERIPKLMEVICDEENK